MATVKPSPSAPSSPEAGTRTSVKLMEVVGMSDPNPRQGTRRASNPGVSVGTTKALTPP